MRHIFE